MMFVVMLVAAVCAALARGELFDAHCPKCQADVQAVENAFATNATDTKIIDVLLKICDDLPAKDQASCKAAIAR